MRTFLVNKNGLQNSYGWSIVDNGRVMYSGYLNGKEEDLTVDEYYSKKTDLSNQTFLVNDEATYKKLYSDIKIKTLVDQEIIKCY